MIGMNITLITVLTITIYLFKIEHIFWEQKIFLNICTQTRTHTITNVKIKQVKYIYIILNKAKKSAIDSLIQHCIEIKELQCLQ